MTSDRRQISIASRAIHCNSTSVACSYDAARDKPTVISRQWVWGKNGGDGKGRNLPLSPDETCNIPIMTAHEQHNDRSNVPASI
jgi:hypothetical protein